MTHLFNDNHTFLLLLVLIGGYKVFSFAIDLFRALPLMYYWWRVTKKCEGAYNESFLQYGEWWLSKYPIGADIAICLSVL